MGRGYGFIQSSEVDGDIFVHANTLRADGWIRLPAWQDILEAEIEQRAAGWYALHVREAQHG
jgi:cold shock CspA family protein